MRPTRQGSQEKRPPLKTGKNSLSGQKTLGNQQSTPLLENKVQQDEAIRSGDISGAIIASSDVDSEISYDKAFERAAGFNNFVIDQLKISNKQTREQAQCWFKLSLLAAGLGFLLFVAGHIFMFGQLTTGMSCVIPSVAAALFFSQSKVGCLNRALTVDRFLDSGCQTPLSFAL